MNLPNKLTIARIIAVPFFMAAYIAGWYVPALIIFIAASLTDMLDGKIARKYGLVTNFGKIMDPLADKILVYAAFCLMVEDGTIVIAAGMSGKIKTVLQMIAVPLLMLMKGITGTALAGPVRVLAYVFLWASLVMTVYSGVEYILQNKQVFSMKEGN